MYVVEYLHFDQQLNIFRLIHFFFKFSILRNSLNRLKSFSLKPDAVDSLC